MNIVFFSTYFVPYISGIITSPFRVLQYLARKGCKVTVLTFHYDSRLRSEETLEKIRITRMPFLFRISKGFFSPQSLLYYWRLVRQCDSVIVNAPNFEGIFLVILGKLLKKKIFVIFNCRVFLQKDIYSVFVNHVLNTSVFLQLKLSDIIITYTKDYFDHIGFAPEFEKKTLYTFPVIDKLPTDRKFAFLLRQKKQKKIWLGYAGRIAREKGIEYLIETADLLRKTYPDITLVFAGPSEKQVVGEQEYFRHIINLLKRSKLSYEFFGCLSKEKLGSFYQSIDALILPSINETEAFGIVQVESMLLGTPVIANNLPGVRIPVKLTRMGAIVDVKRISDFHDTVIDVVRNRSFYTTKSLQAKTYKIFQKRHVLQKYYSIICPNNQPYDQSHQTSYNTKQQ